MANLSLKDKARFLISWTLVLMCSAATQDYHYHDWRNLTWEGARRHCQVCFKELVTVTPENTKTISQILSSDSWIGLRKNFTLTSNSSLPWSRWADGEPLVFQNWYPGWPVSKSSFPKIYFCRPKAETTTIETFADLLSNVTVSSVTASSVTARSVTDSSVTDSSVTDNSVTDSSVTDNNVTDSNVTDNNVTASSVKASNVTEQNETEQCTQLQVDFSETDGNYIEDSCVAMLSFGAWVEKKCSEFLPFICYEDRFFGKASATEKTSESANLTWQRAPGDISHYRVEVKSDGELTKNLTEELTLNLVDLRAGTRYSVQVFPVKCNRDLNVQEVVFYTTPNKVGNLTVDSVTETSVFLSWKRPAGNMDHYLAGVQGGEQIKRNKEDVEVGSLIPGNLYTFAVLSVVEGNSIRSDESNITAYTKPGKVSNLRVTHNTKSLLRLNWEQPEGTFTGFLVKATSDANGTFFAKNVSKTGANITEPPPGTKITFSVTALTDDGKLQGEEVTITNYTAPGSISNLTLVTKGKTLTAEWKSSAGSSSTFTVELQLGGKTEDTVHKLTEPLKRFDKLKNGAKYTVVVYAVSGHLRGPPLEDSKLTNLLSPGKASVKSAGKNQITYEWTAPEDMEKVRYSVRINSSFWGQTRSDTVEDKTSYTFSDLTSGTRYDFEVRSVVDKNFSDPATVSHCTDAEEREISLAMLCSSSESLLCDKNTTRESVFDQLHEHFNKLLGDKIFWKLEKQETEN